MLRTIKSVTRKDRIRSTTVRVELHAPLLLEEIERNRLRWYGHIMRMEEGKKPKRYLMWKPEGKRPAGRPRKRWIEGVEAALGNRGTSVQEVETNKKYDDRRDWRGFLGGSLTDRQ